MASLNALITRHSLRFLLSLTSLCVTLPLLAMVLLIGHEQFQLKKEEVSAQVSELSGLFALKHGDVLLHARTLLETLATDPDLSTHAPEQLRSRFQQIMRGNPQYAYLTLAAPDGALCVSSASTDTSLNFSDREPFLLALMEDRFSVGPATVSRTVGLPVLPFGAPVKNAAGELTGVLLLGLRIDAYDRYFEKLHAPPGSRFILFNAQGLRLLRYPPQEISPVGQTIRAWKTIAATHAQTGTFTFRDEAGRDLTYAFHKFYDAMELWDLGVLVGIPTPSWSSQFLPIFGRTMALLLVVAAIGMGTNNSLSRRIVTAGVEALSRQTARIAQGEPLTGMEGLTGCREIMALGRSFVAMGEALAQNREARDAAEASLQAESIRFRALLETASDGIHILDAEGRLLLCSSSFAQMLGYTPEEATALNVADWEAVIPPKDLTAAFYEILRMPCVFETRHRRKDGTLLDVEVSARSVELDGRRLLYASARDITWRKKAEEKLRNQHAMLVRTERIAHIGSWEWDVATDTMQWSEGVFQIFQLHPEEGAPAFARQVQLYPPEDWERLCLAVARTRDDGSPFELELRILRADGAVRFCLGSGCADVGPDGSVPRLFGLLEDITERRLMEEALREREANFRSFFETMADMIWVVSLDGRVQLANRAAERILGYSAEELRSMLVWEVHPADRQQEGETIFKSALQGEQISCALPLARKNGSLVPAETRIWRGYWQNTPCLFGLSKDLTAEQEAQQRFERLFRNNPAWMALFTLPDRRFMDANSAFLTAMGYSLHEVLGHTALELDLFPKTEDHSVIISGLQDKGRITDYELQLRCKDGSLRDGILSAEAIESQGERFLLAVMVDITARKQAEEALREERNRFAAGPVITLTWGLEASWPVLYVSSNVEKILGFTPEEMTAKGFSYVDLIHPDDQERIAQEVSACQGEGVTTCEQSYRLRNRSGAYAWFYDFTQFVRDRQGVVVSIRGYLFDQSKLKQAEERLARQRWRLANIIEGARIGTWEWNVQTGEVFCNEIWGQMLGYALEELAPMSIEDWNSVMHPEDLQHSKRLLAQHFAGELAYYDFECRVLHRDGHWVWVHDCGQLFTRTEAGEPLLMFGTHQDISARKGAEEALRESEERYRSFFTSLEAIKLLLDPATGAIKDANPAAVEFYGYDLTQLQHMFVYDLNILPREELLAELAAAAARGRGHYFFRHRLASGVVRDVEVYASAIHYRDTTLLMSSIHDVTELRRLEQIKEDVERIVRHDLKSPLNALINIPLLLLEEKNLTADQRELLGMVAASGRRMLSQINSSLELHKIETGAYEFHAQECDPLQLVLDIVELLSVSMSFDPDHICIHDHTAAAAAGKGRILLHTDGFLLDIVLMNLLRNAVEASPPQDPVGVDFSEDATDFVIAISNSGCVPLEIRDRFFDKYATAGKRGGTGLGTYSAAIMTRAMGGTISMETSEETGTSVTVRLPRRS